MIDHQETGGGLGERQDRRYCQTPTARRVAAKWRVAPGQVAETRLRKQQALLEQRRKRRRVVEGQLADQFGLAGDGWQDRERNNWRMSPTSPVNPLHRAMRRRCRQ